jgi:hypothetical protein
MDGSMETRTRRLDVFFFEGILEDDDDDIV